MLNCCQVVLERYFGAALEAERLASLLRGCRLAEHGADPLHVREGIAEDVVAGVFQVVYLPRLEVSAPLGDWEQAEVEAARVERGHLGLQLGQDSGPFFERHTLPAARGRLYDHIAPVFDPRDHLAEEPDVGARFPRLGLPDVEVYDGRPC